MGKPEELPLLQLLSNVTKHLELLRDDEILLQQDISTPHNPHTLATLTG